MSVSSANLTKLKTNLSLSIQRLKLLEKKKTELAQKSRKEIADYIAQGKAERAKIRVEHIIREDYMVEAMEIVEMYCDTLLARFGMIEQLKTLDEGIEEAVSSLIWVAPRMQSDVKELKVVHDILALKYGKAYAIAARENQMKSVNEKLMIKMGVQAPPKILVERYLIEIARSLNVEYEPDQDILREDQMYRKSQSLLDPTIPPPPGPAGPLIDLGHMMPPSAVPGVAGFQPPPLPQQPPAGGSSGAPGAFSAPPGGAGGPSSPSEKTGGGSGVGFAGYPPPNSKSFEGSNIPQMPPTTLPPGAQSVPPSYDSVVTGQNLNPTNRLPDFDESELPEIPSLPEIPTDDNDEAFKKMGGSNGNSGAGNNNSGKNDSDFDFDDLKRRFDELKKKK